MSKCHPMYVVVPGCSAYIRLTNFCTSAECSCKELLVCLLGVLSCLHASWGEIPYWTLSGLTTSGTVPAFPQSRKSRKCNRVLPSFQAFTALTSVKRSTKYSTSPLPSKVGALYLVLVLAGWLAITNFFSRSVSLSLMRAVLLTRPWCVISMSRMYVTEASVDCRVVPSLSGTAMSTKSCLNSAG